MPNRPNDSITQLADDVISRTERNGAAAGYRLLQEAQQTRHLTTGEQRNLNDRLVGAHVLPDLALAYLEDRQRHDGVTRSTRNDLADLGRHSNNQLETSMINSIQSQYEALSERRILRDGGFNTALYQENIDRVIRERDNYRHANPLSEQQARGYGPGEPGPARNELGPNQRELAVRPNEGYWSLAARALGVEDTRHMTADQSRETQNLMDRIRRENGNRTLHPNESITIRW